MESRAYMEEHLKQIHDRFPSLLIKYHYDPMSMVHIVVVAPQYEFDGNSEYIDMEVGISMEFDRLFTPETVLFTSENSLPDADHPELVFKSSTRTGKRTEALIQSGMNPIVSTATNLTGKAVLRK